MFRYYVLYNTFQQLFMIGNIFVEGANYLTVNEMCTKAASLPRARLELLVMLTATPALLLAMLFSYLSKDFILTCFKCVMK